VLTIVILSYFVGGNGMFFNMAQGIGSLELIVKAPIIIIKEGTDVAFSAGLLFESLDSYIKVFLNQLDLFRIWSAVVLGFGFSRLYEKSTGTGIAAVSIVWLIMTAISSALTFIGQQAGA
jgi:hypothetical protein